MTQQDPSVINPPAPIDYPSLGRAVRSGTMPVELVKGDSGYDGMPVSLDVSGGSGGSNFPTIVTITRPSLVRLDALMDSAGSFMQPTSLIAALSLHLIAFPAGARGQKYVGAFTPTVAQGVIRGTGPLIWLPAPGRWEIVVIDKNSAIPIGTKSRATVLHGLDPEIAARMLAGKHSFSQFSARPVIAALGTSYLPVSVTDAMSWFGMTYLRITSIAGSANIAVGDTASAAIGHAQATPNYIELFWETLAGQTVSAFSTAGATLDIMGRCI